MRLNRYSEALLLNEILLFLIACILQLSSVVKHHHFGVTKLVSRVKIKLLSLRHENKVRMLACPYRPL